MEYLGLILGIIFVILIALSVYFDFAEKVIDWWIKIEGKFSKLFVLILFVILILSVFYRFY
jgi:pheromone shutdown protein TraB